MRGGRVYEILDGKWSAAGVGDMEDKVFIGGVNEMALGKEMRGASKVVGRRVILL
jgi:hypothetical protein